MPDEAMLVGLGLPRSGTHFLARAVTPPRRSVHELDARRHCVVAAEYLRGNIPDAFMAKYLAARVTGSALDADVSSINAHGAHLWADVTPQARFVFTFREPMDWVDSFTSHKSWMGSPSPYWLHLRLARMRPDLWPVQTHDEPLRIHGVWSLDSLLYYWASHVRSVLAGVPADRLLVLRTRDLDAALPGVADFLGWPVSALRPHLLRDAVPAGHRIKPPLSAQLDSGHVDRVMRRQLVGIDWNRLGVSAPSGVGEGNRP